MNEVDPHSLIKVFIAQLAVERDIRGFTQADIGEYIGHEHTIVSAWERGLKEPKLSAFIRWADGLGFDVALIKQRGHDDG